jgi:hypothetical protein
MEWLTGLIDWWQRWILAAAIFAALIIVFCVVFQSKRWVFLIWLLLTIATGSHVLLTILAFFGSAGFGAMAVLHLALFSWRCQLLSSHYF